MYTSDNLSSSDVSTFRVPIPFITMLFFLGMVIELPSEVSIMISLFESGVSILYIDQKMEL